MLDRSICKKQSLRLLTEFRVGTLECPKRKAKFKFKVSAISKTAKTNVEDLIIRIKEIQQGFMRTLMVLMEKIMILETEQVDLLEEIEQLKRAAESRASALVIEVKGCRKSLKC